VEALKLTRRLRKAGRQLGRVRDIDTQTQLLDRILRVDRGWLLRELRDALGPEADRRWETLSPRKLASRLERLVAELSAVSDKPRAPQADRTMRWAAQARLARRSRDVRDAVRAAGAIYEPEQLHSVRIAVKKLRYAAEVASDAGAAIDTGDLALLKRVQTTLGRQHDAQVLLDHVRDAEKAIANPPPDAWREAESAMTVLETRCHRLHARFLGERAALLDACDRLGGVRAALPATGRLALPKVRRKVG
jgi:CHAD domain-containing protein